MFGPTVIHRRFVRAVCGMAALLVIVAAGSADDKTAPQTDPYGDPLPKGAVGRLGTQRWRHDADVTFVAFADGGEQVLSSCGDGIIHVWETKSGKLLRTFFDKIESRRGQGSGSFEFEDDYTGRGVTPIASPDGRLLVIR